jgi:hypothetical protein
MKDKSLRLFLILGAFFLANALLAEFIGVKIFSLELSLGLNQLNLSMLGQTLNFDMTAGVLLWPVVFILTDIINEYYGKRGVRLISFLAAGLIAYCFLMVFLAIHLHPADWWTSSKSGDGLTDFQLAFKVIFGQSNWIVVASLVAFLIGQFTDVFVFHKLRNITGEKMIWLRATGSTLVSQFIDSFVVLFIAFGIGAGWPMKQVIAIGIINYAYKFTVAIVLTPILYLAHNRIDRYLGHELAHELKEKAAED